jgi:hypothetical protein
MALAACAMLATSSADAAVKVRYLKGQPTFVSVEHSSAIYVAVPSSARDRQVPIFITAFNGGPASVSLGYENISVATRAGLPVKLVTYEELQHQARVRAGWITFFAILAAGANSYAAERSAYGYVGPYRYYSPAAAEIGLDRASAENAGMLGSIDQALAAKMAQLDGQVLRTTTIDRGDVQGGAVYVDLPRNMSVADLVVTVNFAGDSHRIGLGDASSLEQASASDLALTAPTPPQAVLATAAPLPAPPTPAPAPPKHHRCALTSPTDPDSVTC